MPEKRVLQKNAIDRTGGMSELVQDGRKYFIRIFNQNTSYEQNEELATNTLRVAKRQYNSFIEAVADKNIDSTTGNYVPYIFPGWSRFGRKGEL